VSSAHRKRFRKWQNLCGPRTRFLSSLVESRLVPVVESSGCLGCHRIGENGSRTGPNLSEIGDKRSAEQLKTSITDPDAEVLPENRFVAVTLKDGSTVRGRILNHDAMSVQLIDDKQNLRSFLTANIRGYTILTKGLMPKPNLTDEQVADVVAYLSSLKGPEAP